MTRRGGVGAGAIVFAAFAVFAAGCSSSDKIDSSPTTAAGTPVTVPGVPVTRPNGTPVTKPDGTPVTTPGGVQVTTPNGTPVTLPDGTPVTTPAPPVTTPGQTTPPTTAPRPAMRFKLALDFRTHPGTNPFAGYAGGPTVWSLRESQTRARNGKYTKLPTYSAAFGSSGIDAWHGGGSSCGGVPAIGVNTGGSSVCNANVPFDAAFAIPDPTRMAVVAWTSPFKGTANISAGIADLDPTCGDGIRYYVDRGTAHLATTTLTNGNSMTLQPLTTRIAKGQSLYFIVDAGPSGNADCDVTQLQITVDLP